MPDGPVLVSSEAEARRMLAESLGKVHEGRVYDFYLGGSANYAADREFGKLQVQRLPEIPWAARQNRKYIDRSVQHMLRQGIRQFVDFGSGLPTEGNVHQIVERYTSDECHVVYVDHDPVASAHAYLLLKKAGKLALHQPITADIVDHHKLWDAVLGAKLINPNEPVGLLMVAVWHFVPDKAEPRRAMDYYRQVAAPGSHLAISHASVDGMPRETKEALASVLKDYDRTTSQAFARTRAEVREFFGDWEVLDPGIVWTPEWTTDLVEPDSIVGDIDPYRSLIIGGMARKA